MLSRRPSNGLYTYNFELGHLRITTHEPATSLILDHPAKLILTLRQFRDAPRGKAKKTETGYLLILHSGTTAVVGQFHKKGLAPAPRSNRARTQERLDLRKVRQSTSHGGAPAYKIRGEDNGIEFQYLCSDGNVSAGSTVSHAMELTPATDPEDPYRVSKTRRVREGPADTLEPGAFCHNQEAGVQSSQAPALNIGSTWISPT